MIGAGTEFAGPAGPVTANVGSGIAAATLFPTCPGSQLLVNALATGTNACGVTEVLFVCVHNTGRSQMAAAFMRHHGQGRFQVRSGGSEPAAKMTKSSYGYRPLSRRWPDLQLAA